MALTQADWAEIGELDYVRDLWGLDDTERFEDLTDSIYAVKFDFTSDCPGYCGDLYILQGSALTGFPPVTLIRDDGKLRALEYDAFTPAGEA